MRIILYSDYTHSLGVIDSELVGINLQVRIFGRRYDHVGTVNLMPEAHAAYDVLIVLGIIALLQLSVGGGVKDGNDTRLDAGDIDDMPF